MSVSDTPARLEDLLAHHAWVRSLARALVRDVHEADDVEQQTWLAAAAGGPSDPDAARGWLGTVVRNVVRKRHRTRSRRLGRELHAATGDVTTVGDPADLAARAELHSRVAAAVVALRQPYKDAILLRYFGGHPVAEVARRSGVPHETARAHLRRGREMLRARLGREFQDDPRFGAALWALAGGKRGAGAKALGGTIMSAKLLAAGSAVLVALAGGAWWALSGSEPAPDVARVPGAAPDAAPDPDPQPAPDATRTEPARPRKRVRTNTPTAPAAGTEAAAEVDSDAAPKLSIAERLAVPIDEFSLHSEKLTRAFGLLSGLANVPVHVDADAAKDIEEIPLTLQMQGVGAGEIIRTMGMIAGGLQMAVEEDRVVVHGKGAAWKSDLPTVLIEPVAHDPNAPTTYTVRGTVLDRDGRSVPDAAIMVGITELARTDESGSYSFDTKLRSVQLFATCPMYVRSRHFMATAEYGETREHDFVLGPPGGVVEVTLRDEQGDPVPKVRGRLSWTIVGADGRDYQDARQFLSNAEGVLRCDHAPANEVTVRIRDRNFAPVMETILARAGSVTKHEITLRRTSLAERLKDERIGINFEDIEVMHVTGYLQNAKSVPIIVSPEIRADVNQRRVSIHLVNTPIGQVLDELCAQLDGVTYEVKERYVFIKKDAK